MSLTDFDIDFNFDMASKETLKMIDAATGEEVSFADVWKIPCEEFNGLWEKLIYESNLKENTLRIIETAMEYSASPMESNQIGWNRVVLLHGSPGTGKTDLCRALAQKLAVRLYNRFPRACFLEINTHALFSKWSANSETLLAKMFKPIREIMEDKHQFVCVLIDGVDLLTNLKSTDSMRPVNVILKELDRLEQYPNALILTTSNVIDTIDNALLDRAIQQHLDSPSKRIAYILLSSCCRELMLRGVVVPLEPLLDVCVLEATNFARTRKSAASLNLWHVASLAGLQCLSPRVLHRLPILAQAHILTPCNLLQFIEALLAVVLRDLRDSIESIGFLGVN